MANKKNIKALPPEDAAIAKVLMERNRGKNFVDRAFDPNQQSIQVLGEPGRSTHLMAYDNNRVYPTIIQNENGQLQHLEGDQAWDYADKTGEYITTPTEKIADMLSNYGYKKATGMPTYEMGGTMKQKTPKKILNKVMPIKAYAGVDVLDDDKNTPPYYRSSIFNPSTNENVTNGSMPPPLQNPYAPDPNFDPNDSRGMPRPSMNDMRFNNPNTNIDMQAQPMQDNTADTSKPFMKGNWSSKPNSTHSGQVNIDSAEMRSQTLQLLAGMLPETHKNDNQKKLLYGYNPTPNGSGTQAIYADGGGIPYGNKPVSPEERDAFNRYHSALVSQPGRYARNWDHNEDFQKEVAQQTGWDYSRNAAIQQDMQSGQHNVNGITGGDPWGGNPNWMGSRESQKSYANYQYVHLDANGKPYSGAQGFQDRGTQPMSKEEMNNWVHPQPQWQSNNQGIPMPQDKPVEAPTSSSIQPIKRQQQANWHTNEDTNYDMHAEAKSGIHIKPENKGKFTAYKKRTGKTTAEALHSKDPHVRKMANFARNAKKWHHKADGGPIREEDIYDTYDYPEEAAYGINVQGEGNIQPISSNPYSDSILLHEGESHDNGGIKQLQFGKPIETEGGETQYGNTIFGNMTFPKVDGVTVKDFTGKKFKNIGKDIAAHENKAQRVATKASALLKGDPTDRFGSLTVNSGVALSDSASQKQRALSQQKEFLTRIQQGMLDLSDQTGVKPEEMHKQFKNGGFIKAKNGYSDDILKQQQQMLKDHKDWVDEALQKYGMPKAGKFDDGLDGPRTRFVKDYVTRKANEIQPIAPTGYKNLKVTPPAQTDMEPINANMTLPNIDRKLQDDGTEKKKMRSLADYNKISPWDFLAESRYLMDQPDQVTSQQYNPQMMSPYQVSFQDRINRNDSTFRAVSQQHPDNPAITSVMAGQNYDANNEVAAEEFRANQGIFNSVMNSNYSLQNEAQKMNIQLNDQQMVRQAQAKAITDSHKAQALKSIADTIDKNRYENMNIKMLEARHKYTYDPNSGKMLLDDGTVAPFDFSGSGQQGPSGNTTFKYKYNPATGQYEPSEKEIRSQSTASAKWGGMFKR